MAIDLYSENSGTGNNIPMSPRISFSHDLSQSDTIPVERLLRSLSSSSSVDFNFCVQQNSDHSMADELFSDGKIIPAQIKQPPPPLPPQIPPVHQTNSSKSSFWGFKRSSSCGNGYARSLCPIPLLSRSNSTGSSSSTKRSSSSKEGSNRNPNYQKPPLRRTSYSYGSNHNNNYNNNNNNANGVRINPVINLGFGSLFSTGKKKYHQSNLQSS